MPLRPFPVVPTANLFAYPDAILVGTAANPTLKTIEAWSVVAALALGVTDTTTMNIAFGHFSNSKGDVVTGLIDDVTTLHVNLIWQPVSRFRMGVEGMYGYTDRVGLHGTGALRFQFGAWFFF